MKTPAFFSLLSIAAMLALVASHDAQAHGDRCNLPFQTSGTIVLEPGFSGSVGQFSVPAGFRLQIEQVSAEIRLVATTDRAGFTIGTVAGGAFAWHNLRSEDGFGAIDRQTSGPVTLYADAKTDVKIAISRISDTTVQANGRYTLTGCLYPVTRSSETPQR